jgi:FKBP-type peptidyl-prolyl cis-trans isomerase
MSEEKDKDRKEPVINRAPVEPNSHEELMYALGVNLARQLGDVRPLVEDGQELTYVAKGLLDAVIGRLSEEGQRLLLKERQKDLNVLITERANKISQGLMKAGESMLKTMSETEGVTTLPSGVCLHVLDHGPEGPGEGVRPSKTSVIKVHYHGTLADGTIFDSTLGEEEPVTFALANLIPGWKEGLLLMHQGETAMIGIPPTMAYGSEGTPDGRIPSNAYIFFKVQLIEVVTAGIGGSPTLLGVDGKKLSSKGGESSLLLGVDGKPLK